MSRLIQRFVARLMRGSREFSTLNHQTVRIHLQTSPGVPDGDERGIDSMDFRVTAEGGVIVEGRTGNDGLVTVPLPGGRATLELLHEGNVAAEYEITTVGGDFVDVSELRGLQQRLRRLGYQIGHDGDAGNGTDGERRRELERSILDFQADSNLLPNAEIGEETRIALTSAAGG